MVVGKSISDLNMYGTFYYSLNVPGLKVTTMTCILRSADPQSQGRDLELMYYAIDCPWSQALNLCVPFPQFVLIYS